MKFKMQNKQNQLFTGPTEQNVQGVLQYELAGAFVAGPIEHPDLTYKTV
jgi:hypothetical protein